MQSSGRTAIVVQSLLASIARPVRWLARHQTLCLILFVSFVARLFLADRNSYWYDEILSVVTYGSSHNTIASAMESLAAKSAHPPLYHFLLFYWMQLFGTAEVATRTLSNLYITAATFCLYVLALRLFGRRVALASTLLFAFSYTPTLFALEVRSYAQSLFLVTLSSLLLLRWLERLDGSPAWRQIFSGRGILLLLCNIALLLTHYSNALFVVVQALFVGFYLGHRSPGGMRLQTIAKAAIFYIGQFAVALALWGPIALATKKRFAGSVRFAVEGAPAKTPLEIFINRILDRNFDLPQSVYLAVFVFLVIVLARVAIRHFFRSRQVPPVNAYFLFYLTAWAILPCVLAYLLFFATGMERYSARYFAICVPPLSILLVLAIEQFIESLHSAQRVFQFSVRRHYLRNATLYALAICAIFTLPRAYAAATYQKDPYREIARSIVTLVEHDRESSFAIYEAAYRTTPMLNYYFRRFSKRTRVDGTVSFNDETKGRDTLAGAELDKDYLVIAFPHLSVRKFPSLMQRLHSQYDVTFSQLAGKGRGYIVFKLRPPDGADKKRAPGDGAALLSPPL